MDEQLITLQEYCKYYKVELSFLCELEESGLLPVREVDQKKYISFDQIPVLESYTRLFYELDINIPGIDAIQHLLSRLKSLQQEMDKLERRINFMETEINH